MVFLKAMKLKSPWIDVNGPDGKVGHVNVIDMIDWQWDYPKLTPPPSYWIPELVANVYLQGMRDANEYRSQQIKKLLGIKN